jgi:hypothetical protein
VLYGAASRGVIQISWETRVLVSARATISCSSICEQGQRFVPTGIHWQASQAITLQNLEFLMPIATSDKVTSHVGIFTENGNAGCVLDQFHFSQGPAGYGGRLGYVLTR